MTEESESGYLYISSETPWTGEMDDILDRIPDDWTEVKAGQRKLKSSQKKNLPQRCTIQPDGMLNEGGIDAAFLSMPFRFCLNRDCKVAYNARQRSDIGKLSTIGVDGRSTATTILALGTILKLRAEESLPTKARKLLSFTDNRQDASLQAGHFNDFVEVGLIRSALYKAMVRLGDDCLTSENLLQHVERALNLPVHLFANDPELRGPALEETRKALRKILGFIVYRDLRRDWRVTSPNLEQCGLLEFEYVALDDIANDNKYWEEQNIHATLVSATPEQRKKIIRVLLDHLRRNLCIKEEALDKNYQEEIAQLSRQRLIEPWAIADEREMIRGGVAWPGSGHDRVRYEDITISSRSNFGLFLRRPDVLPDLGERLTLVDTDEIIHDLFRALRPWGLVEIVRSDKSDDKIVGYQIPSSILRWRSNDGSNPAQDELRIITTSNIELSGNEYFVRFYKEFVDSGAGLEGREHTAQVPAVVRIEREQDFRTGSLPLMFCSPTMELGVDISQLNVVNMRNVPPTPANYAQRSGRAGRSGQPALVYTYCSGFSPHDQYYFRQPERMVSGVVTAPRLDLLNRDLITSHIHAIWLAEAKLNLGTTLSELLVVTEENLKLPLNDRVKEALTDSNVRLRARTKAIKLLDSIGEELPATSWYREDWLDDVLNSIPQSFEEACNRWRSLYRAAVQQRTKQNKTIGDHTRTADDRVRAKRLRAQAESQIALLTNPKNVFEGDFYSYRYFASEGFLPGYNFPRLPLSAFIPARRGRRGRDEYLSRPRFLAISEFGPRAVVYHEGARYRINKVNIAFDEDTNEITDSKMKVCSQCGYAHHIDFGVGPDVCDSCTEVLTLQDELRDLVRLQNVTAKRVERITCDEEERMRIGYEIRHTFCFSSVNGKADYRAADVLVGENRVAILNYGDAATIWRINIGWRKRKMNSELGYLLDTERGYWATNKDLDDQDVPDDMVQGRIKRVIPYVEDHRNVLTLRLVGKQDVTVMASLQAALKQGIQRIYQLEPSELGVEPLPDKSERNLLFFYEASEGGAGVLRQIAEKPSAFASVVREALNVCHFDPDSGKDLAEGACEAACYDCLLEYGNQPDHTYIDRQAIKQILMDLSVAVTAISGSALTPEAHYEQLFDACDSQLEKKWLALLKKYQLMPPTTAQQTIDGIYTRPDFFYEDARAAIYIDGPPHDSDEQKQKDDNINTQLTDAGYLVIRFHHEDHWETKLDEYSEIFGNRVEPTNDA